MAKTTIRSRSVKSPRDVACHEPLDVSGTHAFINDINRTPRLDPSATSQKDWIRLPERPSTSGGPVKSSMRTSSFPRETRDDLHFNPLAAHSVGNLSFNHSSPVRSPVLRLQSPQTSYSPQISPIPQPSRLKSRKSSTNTRETPIIHADSEDMMSARPWQQNEAPIGMALGSPAHPTGGWQATSWQPQGVTSVRVLSPEQDISSEGWNTPPASAVKAKGSKWKLLGGLLMVGRKPSEPQAFYQVRPEPSDHQPTVAVNADWGESTEAREEKRPRQRGRTMTTSGQDNDKNKPEIARSKTAPMPFVHDPVNPPSPPKITVNGGRDASSSNSSGLLNVDIPTTQMERYSIMFGSVLHNSPNASSSSSSLLARRQATLERLKSVNDELAAKERELEERLAKLRPRRATSPQPAKSPAFSLFPSTTPRLNARQPSPLQRSNTAPAVSPSRQTFDRVSEDIEMHASLSGPAPHVPIESSYEPRETTSRPRPKIAASFRKKVPGPTPNVPTSTEMSGYATQRKPSIDIARSRAPWDIDSEEEETLHLSFRKPTVEEPAWKMSNVTMGTVTSISAGSMSSRSGGHSTSTSVSSVSNSSNPSSSQLHKLVEIKAAPAGRRRRATTTTAAPRFLTRPAEVSNAVFGASPSPQPISMSPKPISKDAKHTEVDPEREEQLKSAAEISIARQISVSHQQRQLLIPITKPKSASPPIIHNSTSPKPASRPPPPLRKPSSTSALSSPNHSRNPSSSGTPIALARSPLAMVSNPDPESPTMGIGTPLAPRPRMAMVAIKPSTPTLVVTDDDDHFAKSWAGQMQTPGPAFLREEMSSRRGNGSPSSLGSLGNRKSERVVLESY